MRLALFIIASCLALAAMLVVHTCGRHVCGTPYSFFGGLLLVAALMVAQRSGREP